MRGWLKSSMRMPERKGVTVESKWLDWLEIGVARLANLIGSRLDR